MRLAGAFLISLAMTTPLLIAGAIKMKVGLFMQVQNDTCLAAAMERYVAAKTAYEALFDSIDPMFSPGRCKQHTDSLVWARVELQRHTEQAVGSGLVERAQEMLQAPVHRGGFAVKPESLEPPEMAETLYANT